MTVTEILDSFCFILNAHRRIEKDTLRAKKATVSRSEHILKMTRTYKHAVIGMDSRSSVFEAQRIARGEMAPWRGESWPDLSWLAL